MIIQATFEVNEDEIQKLTGIKDTIEAFSNECYWMALSGVTVKSIEEIPQKTSA